MGLLEILVIILVLLWLTGAFVVPVGGSAIHLLLVIVIVIVIVRLVRGERL
jgi:hypothetical protein